VFRVEWATLGEIKMKKVNIFFIFSILTILMVISGCAKTIRVHPSYYAASIPGGKIDKKVAVVIPTSEKYKKYTYHAWWAGWSAGIELGEALEEISMKTISSLYRDVFLVREKPDYGNVDLIFTPTITHYRHDVPTFFARFVPSTATITIHVKLEDSNGKVLIDRDYNGKDSKSHPMDTMWDNMEELAEKVFEQTFEIIASDLRKVSTQKQ
jgi:hypothetical protein